MLILIVLAVVSNGAVAVADMLYVSTSVVYRTGSYGRVGLIRCSGTTTSRVHIDVRCSVNRSGCSRNCRSAAVADYGTWRYDVTR